MLFFTGKKNMEADESGFVDAIANLPEPNIRAVREAVSITSRQLVEAQSALPAAQQALDSAKAHAAAASRRRERARQACIDALVAAKTAKTRATLLDIEVKRAMDEAVVQAEKARIRVIEARRAANLANVHAKKAQERAGRVKRSEETAAAEAICAEGRLETNRARLQTLTHAVLTARTRMKLFNGNLPATADPHPVDPVDSPDAMGGIRPCGPRKFDEEAGGRRQLLADLLELEASLADRKRPSAPVGERGLLSPENHGRQGVERRQHERLVYPDEMRPVLSIGNLRIPIRDLSPAGMRLAADPATVGSPIVRGVIDFDGHPPVKVTGKVVRRDGHDLGLRLVTRIGSRIIEQERLGLIA